MKKIYLALLLAASLGINSCKKCWKCDVSIDGSSNTKICDKTQVEYIESMKMVDKNGNVSYPKCR